MNKQLKIFFDIDDSLIIPSIATGFDRDVPNYETIAIYKWFQAQGYHMGLWSGGGVDYAKTWADKLGLVADEFRVKQKYEDIDLVFDDCDVDLGKVNVKIKRLNNNVSRKEWNKNKTG